jgi:hypothetical protein
MDTQFLLAKREADSVVWCALRLTSIFGFVALEDQRGVIAGMLITQSIVEFVQALLLRTYISFL